MSPTEMLAKVYVEFSLKVASDFETRIKENERAWQSLSASFFSRNDWAMRTVWHFSSAMQIVSWKLIYSRLGQTAKAQALAELLGDSVAHEIAQAFLPADMTPWSSEKQSAARDYLKGQFISILSVHANSYFLSPIDGAAPAFAEIIFSEVAPVEKDYVIALFVKSWLQACLIAFVRPVMKATEELLGPSMLA